MTPYQQGFYDGMHCGLVIIVAVLGAFALTFWIRYLVQRTS